MDKCDVRMSGYLHLPTRDLQLGSEGTVPARPTQRAASLLAQLIHGILVNKLGAQQVIYILRYTVLRSCSFGGSSLARAAGPHIPLPPRSRTFGICTNESIDNCVQGSVWHNLSTRP